MKLYGRLGSGSGAVEAIVRLTGIDCEIVDLDRWPEGRPPAELAAVNPLGEVPSLVLDDGSVMTESAAICVYLSDRHPSAGLSPAIADPRRADFLRWMFYLSANVYMTELQAYYPHRYADDATGVEAVRRIAASRKTFQWSVFSGALGEKPYALGEALSAVDIYAAMLVSWVDDLDAFGARFPNLRGLYDRVNRSPAIASVWSRHGMPG